MEKDSLRKLIPVVDAAMPILLACSWAGLILAVPYTVSMDSPSHLYTSRVAMELLFKPDSPFNKVYELNSGFLPNWGTTLLLSFFNLFVPGAGAERLLKVLLPCFFGAAIWSVLRRRSARASLMVALFYPLIFCFFFNAGFYGFYVGTALMICALHFLLPHSAALSSRRAVLLGFILVTTYYFHMFPFALTVIFIVCSVALDSVIDAKRAFAVTPYSRRLVQIGKGLSYALTLFFWEARRVWLAGLPAIFLLTMHLRQGSSINNGFHFPGLREFRVRIVDILALDGAFSFVAWNQGLKLLALVLFFASFAFALGKKRGSLERLWREEIKLVAFIGCAMLLFLLAPATAGHASFIVDRFLYSAFLLMMLFVAFQLSRKEAWVFCVLAILPFAYLQQRSVYRDAQTLHPYAVQIQNIAQHIPPGSAILSLAYNTTSRRFEAYVFEQAPLRHLDAYLAVRAQAVLLNNYEGMTDHFPLRLRSELRGPEIRILQGEFRPNKLAALKSVIAQHDGVVDYLVIWETDHGSVAEPEKKAIRQVVSANFRLIYENPAPAPLYLYARQSLTS